MAVFLPGLGFLSATPVKLAAGILLALAAYGGEAKLLRLTLLLFAVSCAMAGCVLALGPSGGGRRADGERACSTRTWMQRCC